MDALCSGAPNLVHLFGLEIWSEAALPDLLDVGDENGQSRSPLTVRFVGKTPVENGILFFEECKIHGDGSRVRLMEDESFQLWFGDGTWASVDKHGLAIELYTPPTSTFGDTLTYLYGSLAGLALRLRGTLALHASAAVIDGSAVAFVGPSGTGKSTTAAALALQGIPVMTDDVVALERSTDGGYIVHAGNPYLRLWEDSMLLLEAGPLRSITASWSKRRLPLPRPPVSAPLGSILLLDGAPGTHGAIPLYGGEALAALVPCTFASHLLRPAHRALELTVLGELLQRVPVWKVNPPLLPDDLGAYLAEIRRLVHAPH